MSKEQPQHKHEANPGDVLSFKEKTFLLLGGTMLLLAAGKVIESDIDSDRVFNPITYQDQMNITRSGADLIGNETTFADSASSVQSELHGDNTSLSREPKVLQDDKGNAYVEYPTSEQGFMYTVQDGDSPYGIADRLQSAETPHDQIVDEVQQEAPDGLHPGEQLHLGDEPQKQQ